MEDEDGTCLLDVLCDPQALNDFLHGTNELQTEDLLISSSSGEHSLFTDAPSPVSLLGVDRNSPDTPPPGCVDLSFLEEALLSSPEGGDDLQVEPAGPVETGCKGEGGGTAEEEKGEEEKGEEGVTCDILQQSLQEADITEQTMALEAGLAQPGETLSLYSPAPLLPTAAVPFLPKPVTLPVAPALPRDTQAAVEPPQPSLLAIGPGCPSLKPAAPPQLMGLLPGSVFPAAPPETSFSLSPAQGSSMIIHKAVPSLTGRSLITPTLRTTAAPPSILLQRAPLPIQPKLPISIQPRLVQISPKPSGQKPSPGLTFIPGTPSQNILLSQPAGPKPAPPQPQATQQLPKPVSLQLVNQGGSFVLQPQGLFQGQNQFLLPGQCPVTISQPISAARSLFPPGHQGSSIHSVTPSAGQLVDGPQILTVPHRQLNFSPVFTTPTGQLALRQATVVSGPLQLQSAPPTVFQVPAQIAGTYTPGGQGQRATLVHSPALGNHHITLINSSGVLPPDLTSISILNGPQVVQGLPFPPQTQGAQAGVTEGGLSLQQASVVLLPERTVPEERPSSEETFHQLPQSYGPVLQNVSVQPTTRGLPSPSPSMVPVLRTPPEPPLVQDPAPDPAPDLPKLLVPSAADLAQRAQEADPALAADQGFMQLQQQALRSPLHPSDLLVETLPVASLESLRSPPADETELQVRVQVQVGSSVGPDDALAAIVDRSAEASPLPSSPEATPLRSPSSPVQDAASFSPTGEPGTPAGSQPPTQRQVHHQLQVQVQVLQALRAPEDQEVQMPAPQNQDQARHLVQVQAPSSVYSSPSPLVGSVSGPLAESTSLSPGGEDLPIAQDEEHEPAAPSVMEGEVFPLVLPPSSSLTPQDILPPPPPLALVLGPSMAPPHQQPGTKPPSFHPSPLSPDMWSSRQPVRGEEEQRMEQRIEEKLTPAVRRHRFQTRLVQDQDWVQDPCTQSGFWSLEDAARRLLPYHTCSGATPTQDHFHSVDEEFDSVSRFLLKRTKDMVNKYRQLLLAETQQEIPSAEMVMLERLFLQAERFTLGEERRKARRDPESFLAALSTSASSPHAACSSGPAHPSSSGPAHPGSSSSAHPSASPSPPPAWTRLSDRPPGLRTYRSSSRGGALRLTIKHESGSRKVVRHSSGDPGRRRDHAGRLTNGGGSAGPPAGGPAQHGEEASNGGRDRTPEAQTVPDPQIIKPHGPVSPPEPLSDRLAPSPGGAPAAPQAKRCRAETPPPPPPPPWSKRRGSPPPPPPRQDDAVLSQHLQSAIDSILELQRLQGPPAAPGRAPAGPPLDHAVTGLVGGKPVR